MKEVANLQAAISSEVMTALKIRAAKERRFIKEIVEDAVRAYLATEPKKVAA